MSKKFLAVGFISLPLLTGCFSVDNSTTSTTPTDTGIQQAKVYNDNQFSFSYPGNWDLIEQKDFTSDIPKETQVVIRNNIKNETFTADVNVVKNDLQIDESSLDYAKAVLNRQKTGLLDYKETKRDLVKINVGGQDQDTYYTEFDARLNATDPVTEFIQTYAVKNKQGYIIMAAYSQQETSTVIDQLQKVVKSFKVN